MLDINLIERAKLVRALPYAIERLSYNELDRSPVSMTIRPTSFCNRKCYFCLCKIRNIAYHSIYVNDNIIKQFYEDIYNMDVKGVTIAGGGEPTVLNQRYYKGLFQNNKCRLFWHTNGILIDQYGDELVKNTDYISFSILSHRADLYNRIAGVTGNTQFERVLQNIEAFSNDPKYNTISIQAKLLITKEMTPYLEDYFYHFNKLRLDKIKFSVVKNYENGQDSELSDIDKHIVFTKMTERLGINYNLAKKIVYGLSSYDYTPTRCWVSELGMYATLEPDGRVFLCSQWCFDNTVCLGNINYSPLKTIWYGEHRNRVKYELNSRVVNRVCNFNLCRHYITNIAIDLYVKGVISSKDIPNIQTCTPFI